MDVRVLGCSGGIGGLGGREKQHTTSLLVDHDILIDCGTGLGTLDFEQLLAIDHVFLTHSHLDHIALLPLLVDTVGDLRTQPITVHATEETLRILRAHIFNWLIWPDFTAIPDRTRPHLRMQAMSVGEAVELNGRNIRAIPALHAVPAVGYCLSSAHGSLVFSGDTTVSDDMIAVVNGIDNLRYLIIETAFSDSQHDLALAARHMCPSMLHHVLDRLTVKPEVFITHLKPGNNDIVIKEIQAYRGPLRPQILTNGQRFKL
ncbi:MAG TPA: 3',5'-cyclic-nucleotide phosphodiesterase [Rhodocyclaceae bacterium]|nr:3',5'-cyclic-nucleotide phosphodiesterase [Rhodocyclaceae bacterium]